MKELKTKDAIDEMFRVAVAAGASDVHLKPGSPPKMRKDGQLIPIPGYHLNTLTDEETVRMSFYTMGAADQGILSQVKHGLNYSYAIYRPERIRFRMNVFQTMNERALVARVVSERPKSLGELGIPAAAHTLAAHSSGLVLVTGATGSGKSNTLGGMIHMINTTKNVHIISIEDPVEIVHTDAKASVSQREIGQDVPDPKTALKEALREDPDVIFVGEIRDDEMLNIALDAADTGHLVITTMHTTDAPSAIQRMMSLVLGSSQEHKVREILAASLRGIVSQRLHPRVNGGRVAACEIMLANREIQQAIASGAPDYELHKIIAKGEGGMQTFEQHYARLVKQGTITYESALPEAKYQEELQELLSDHQREANQNRTHRPLSVPMVSAPKLPGLNSH